MANGNTSSFNGIITTNTYNDRLQPILLDAAVPTISVSVSSGTYSSCATLPCTAVFSVSSSAGISVDDIVTVAGNSNSELNGAFTVTAVASGQVTVNFELSSGGSGTGGTLTDDVSGSVFSLCYDFHLGQAIKSGPCNLTTYSTGDNGNVFQALNNVDSTRSAVFAYDPLNRITQANTVNTTSANCWGEAYTIDAWGNLTNINPASGMSGSCTYESLSAGPASTSNQLTGYSYDAAGNLLLNSSFYYDQENRLYNPSAPYTYFYDADGMRIRKAASSTVGTFYWPGANGEYLTEANGSGTINEEYVYFNGSRIARVDRPSGTVHYYFSDQLGSASVVTNASGGSATYDYYYPYGGLVSSSGSDPNHYLFTGKERDNDSGEFGLDYFGARHYGSMMGRFMTPDWAAKPTTVPYANFGNPQSLNLYSYVENNPTTMGDPDGHKMTCTTDDKGNMHCVVTPDPPPPPDPVAIQRAMNDATRQQLVYAAKQAVSHVLQHPAVQSFIMVFAFEAGGEGEEGAEAGAEGADAGTEEAGAESASKHGTMRMAQREVSPADLANMRTGTKMTQADGATVFVKGMGHGKYDVLVEGEKGIVTSMKGLSGQEVRELGERYGWH